MGLPRTAWQSQALVHVMSIRGGHTCLATPIDQWSGCLVRREVKSHTVCSLSLVLARKESTLTPPGRLLAGLDGVQGIAAERVVEQLLVQQLEVDLAAQKDYGLGLG